MQPVAATLVTVAGPAAEPSQATGNGACPTPTSEVELFGSAILFEHIGGVETDDLFVVYVKPALGVASYVHLVTEPQTGQSEREAVPGLDFTMPERVHLPAGESRVTFTVRSPKLGPSPNQSPIPSPKLGPSPNPSPIPSPNPNPNPSRPPGRAASPPRTLRRPPPRPRRPSRRRSAGTAPTPWQR
jgi:hypothetical protein